MIAFRRIRFPALVLVLLLAVGLAVGLAACSSSSSSSSASPASSPSASSTSRPATGSPNFNELIVATTTSLNDSGLLSDVVLPAYKTLYPDVTVKVVAVGSGAAIAMAEQGNADVLLVHSPAAEQQFMADGYGTFRVPFAFNFFTIVGPKNDPAKVAQAKTAAQAFQQIAKYGESLPAGQVAFVSRGDQSGTNTKELSLWAAAGVTPSATPAPTPAPEPTGSWYIKTGQGMAPTLTVADQKQAYTLTDTATYLADKSNLTIVPLLNESADLKNFYNVILINQAKFPVVNSAGAEDLASWLTGPVGQKEIASYGKSQYGQALFFPNSQALPETPQK